jgi:hypothetical protein
MRRRELTPAVGSGAIAAPTRHPGRSGTARRALLLGVAALGAGAVLATGPTSPTPTASARSPQLAAGSVLRIPVPEAIGGKTVIGQLTVDGATAPGHLTAYGCDDGPPVDGSGVIRRSDLNYDGRITPVWSNRLIVQADADGDVCIRTHAAVDMIVDVNAVTFDIGISSFPNRRTDTRTGITPRLPAGGVMRVTVPEAIGGKTVIGQLTVDRATEPGHITAYGCATGPPTDTTGAIRRSDLNYDGRITPVWSNRLIVEADRNGEICFRTHAAVDMIIDINGVSDIGITSFPNRRTDTRTGTTPRLPAGGVMRVTVPEAIGGKTVIGQLTVDRATEPGHITAYGCATGPPTDTTGAIRRSDLNYDGRITPVWSNRLIVEADRNGEICFRTHAAVDMIIDINGVSDIGITSFPNRRTDTRTPSLPPPTIPPGGNGVPVWPQFEPRPALAGVAALTGRSVSSTVAQRPIVAVKIDNYRLARPQFALDRADAIIEENVEGVTRFIALFQTHLPTDVGPVRSARTGDLDVLAGMNRPIFAYSGANAGVMAWIDSAAWSGILVDFSAQRRPCYRRTADRPGPHNLLLDASCAVANDRNAGPAGPLWAIDGAWVPPPGVTSTADGTFVVPMDGVRIEWTWHASSRTYRRSQDGEPHVAASGARITAETVVELRTVHVPSPVDARSPNPITVGTGSGTVHRDGRAIPVTWSRNAPYDPFTFRHAGTGEPVPVDQGRTFLHLVRAG